MRRLLVAGDGLDVECLLVDGLFVYRLMQTDTNLIQVATERHSERYGLGL